MPAVARRGRARPVGGQVQFGRSPGQRVPPPRHLPGQHAARIVLVTKQLSLPDGVVGVLHRQRRPPRRRPGPPGRVRRVEVPGQRCPSTSRRWRCGGCTSTSTCASGPAASSRARTGMSAARSNGCAAIARHRRGQLLLCQLGDLQVPAQLGWSPGPAGTAGRQQRRATRCAAPRAARSHHPARPPARRRRVPPTAAAPSGCCRPRTGPPAGR